MTPVKATRFAAGFRNEYRWGGTTKVKRGSRLAGWLAEVNVDKHHKSWKKSIEQQLQLKEN